MQQIKHDNCIRAEVVFIGYVHTVPIAFAPARKLYWIGLLFTHKNDYGGVISVTERSCAAPISKVETESDIG